MSQPKINSFSPNHPFRSNEIEKKDAFQRRIAGAHMTYHDKNVELGFTAVKTVFNQIILPDNKL